MQPPAQAPEAPARVVTVSAEQLTLIGPGRLDLDRPLPPHPIAVSYHGSAKEGLNRVLVLPGAGSEDLSQLLAAGARVILVLARAAMSRTGGDDLAAVSTARHASTSVRTVAVQLINPPVPTDIQSAYRVAKSLELLCETISSLRAGDLLPAIADNCSEADTRRLLEARRIIDERWCEKLTLNAIARACGLNRSKLTRGFKDLFACTVTEALARQRLDQAGRMLLTTDYPIARVGFESGYHNNASFTRAFGRHFGRTPSDYRSGALAA